MARNTPARDGHRNGAIRDRSQANVDWAKRHQGGREILFPTEPSTIGHKKIDRAVERVISRKK